MPLALGNHIVWSHVKTLFVPEHVQHLALYTFPWINHRKLVSEGLQLEIIAKLESTGCGWHLAQEGDGVNRIAPRVQQDSDDQSLDAKMVAPHQHRMPPGQMTVQTGDPLYLHKIRSLLSGERRQNFHD